MKTSSAMQASLMLVLIMVGCFVAESARHKIKVRKNRTTFKIDWWDDGRNVPYRIIFKKSGLKSTYKFHKSGRMHSLVVGSTKYTFSFIQDVNALPEVQTSSIGSRMLLESEEDEDMEEVHFEHRRLYDCADCENTWDTLCGVGIVDVCDWVPFLPSVFNEDAVTSLTRMCNGMGNACQASAFDTCDGHCIAGELRIM